MPAPITTTVGAAEPPRSAACVLFGTNAEGSTAAVPALASPVRTWRLLTYACRESRIPSLILMAPWLRTATKLNSPPLLNCEAWLRVYGWTTLTTRMVGTIRRDTSEIRNLVYHSVVGRRVTNCKSAQQLLVDHHIGIQISNCVT